ncbi:MAG: TetR/AcrR family transcriptional regulator [Eubacteriales bacterium]|jgi:AcrR family transcriptional regulator
MTTKERIAKCAYRFFFKKGYNNTTYKDIADELGISVGNVSYHYKRKEDLLLGFYTSSADEIKRIFLLHEDLHTDSIVDFIAMRFAFVYWMQQSPMMFRLYHESLLVDVIRDEYSRYNNALLIEFASKEMKGIDARDVYMIGLSASGAEQELMNYYRNRQNEVDFEYIIRYPFKTILLHLDFPKDKIEPTIQRGIDNGHKLYKYAEGYIKDFIG